jgi:hypothetical protein
MIQVQRAVPVLWIICTSISHAALWHKHYHHYHNRLLVNKNCQRYSLILLLLVKNLETAEAAGAGAGAVMLCNMVQISVLIFHATKQMARGSIASVVPYDPKLHSYRQLSGITTLTLQSQADNAAAVVAGRN